VSKGYFYNLSELALWKYLSVYLTKVRALEHTVTVRRFYLDKGLEKVGIPNGKFRPIGAPNLTAKMIFKAIEVIVRELLESSIGRYQHGYMRHRGTQSATLELMMKLRANPKLKVAEFDLKSFFNKVNVARTLHRLEELIGPIAR
jgi:retron-type reverse transcriptase